MPQALAVTLVESTEAVDDGEGDAVDIGEARRAARVSVFVTSFEAVDADPVPSVLFAVQTRAAETLPWLTVDTVSASATGVLKLAVGGLERYVRTTWDLTNMTSAEFEVTAVAHQVYCDPADMVLDSVPEEALEDITASTRANACIVASSKAEGYLAGSFNMPITAWDDDLRAETSALATAVCFKHRGFDPNGPDKLILDCEKAALTWLDRIANGRLKPPGIVDSTPETFEGGSFVVSTTSRGW